MGGRNAPSSPVVLLSHFCEVSGPSRLLCTHTSPTPPSPLPSTPNQGHAAHFVSRVDSPECFACTSTTVVPDGSDELLRKLSLRALSCEQVGPGREGPLLFGDAANGHAFAFVFSVKDAEARGFQRWHALIVLAPPSAMFALSSLWGELSKKCGRIVRPLQTAGERVCEQERAALGIGGGRPNSMLVPLAFGRTPFTLAHTRGRQRLRDLPALLRVPDLYKRLHVEFTRVVTMVEREMLEGRSGTESPWPCATLGAVADDDKRERFTVVSLSHLYTLLSARAFRRVLRHVAQGDQLVVTATRAHHPAAASIAALLHSLLPEHCVLASHPSHKTLPPPYMANIVVAGEAGSDPEGAGEQNSDQGRERDGCDQELAMFLSVRERAAGNPGPGSEPGVPVELHVLGGRQPSDTDAAGCKFVALVEDVVVDSLKMMRVAWSENNFPEEEEEESEGRRLVKRASASPLATVGSPGPTPASPHADVMLSPQIAPSIPLPEDGDPRVRAGLNEYQFPRAQGAVGGAVGLAGMRAGAEANAPRPSSRSLLGAPNRGAGGVRKRGGDAQTERLPGGSGASGEHFATMMRAAGIGRRPLTGRFVGIVSVEAHRLDDVKREWLAKAKTFVGVVQAERRRGQRSDVALEARAEQCLRMLGAASDADKAVVRFWSTGMWKR